MRIDSSASFSDCTASGNSKAPASGSRSFSELFSVTADAFGPKPRWTRVRLSILPFRNDAAKVRNPKSEVRNPKELRKPKSEIRNPQDGTKAASTSHSDFDIRISFGLRISDFGFRRQR